MTQEDWLHEPTKKNPRLKREESERERAPHSCKDIKFNNRGNRQRSLRGQSWRDGEREKDMDPAMDIAMSYAEIDIAETETIRPTGRQAVRQAGGDRQLQAETETNRHTHRQTQIHRQTDGQSRKEREGDRTDRQTDRQTDKIEPRHKSRQMGVREKKRGRQTNSEKETKSQREMGSSEIKTDRQTQRQASRQREI